MVTQQQFKDHYNHLYNSGAIYVWGANGEIITKDLTNRLYRSYGSSTYNKTYYNNKYKFFDLNLDPRYMEDDLMI